MNEYALTAERADARPTTLMETIAELVSRPDANIETIERLLLMKERIDAKAAEAVYSEAMNKAQEEMGPIRADASNPQTKSRYASLAQLDQALRPIYTRHGFSLSFDTAESGAAEVVRMVCDVRHTAGHKERKQLDLPADGKGAKGGDVMTKTHATGSALSYGQRYLLKMIFNVSIGDDDGNAASRPHTAPAPKGFDEWRERLEVAASEGTPTLRAFWDESEAPMRDHMFSLNKGRDWEHLKREAAKANKAATRA